MKNQRQEVILEIINDCPVSTQEKMIELLAERGITATQATLSRDIQKLSLIKQKDADGNYRYTLPAESAVEKSIFAKCVKSVDYSMNTIVVKCTSGMAQATCTAIDSARHEEIMGTIAGDDTIFILVRSESDAKKLAKKLRNILID